MVKQGKTKKAAAKVRTRTVILQRQEDGDVEVYGSNGGLIRATFNDAADLSQLGIYIPKRGSEFKVRITCEILGAP